MVREATTAPREALAILGRLLAWTKDVAPFVPPEMMVQEDSIRYLHTLHDFRRTTTTDLQMAGVSEKETSLMVRAIP